MFQYVSNYDHSGGFHNRPMTRTVYLSTDFGCRRNNSKGQNSSPASPLPVAAAAVEAPGGMRFSTIIFCSDSQLLLLMLIPSLSAWLNHLFNKYPSWKGIASTTSSKQHKLFVVVSCCFVVSIPSSPRW